jgi:SAM-dependent methyltransferase
MMLNFEKKVHLGCGRTILDGWINVDAKQLPGVDLVADLDHCRDVPLPFDSDSIDEFLASHVIEHLVNPLPFMQELHRVAKAGAKAVFRVPYGSSDDAYEDPTHVRQYFLNSFGYFSQPFYWRADYEYRGDWSTESITLVLAAKTHAGKKSEQIMAEVHTLRNTVQEMIVELRAIKPPRAARAELQTKYRVHLQLV